RQPVQFIVSPAVFDREVLALDIAGVLEALAESAQPTRIALGRLGVEEPDHRHSRLLRSRRKRPCRRNAEKRYKLAPLHSITSSARAMSVGGTSMPSALAASRLITNSNLVDCTIGRSAGFVPLRMRPA